MKPLTHPIWHLLISPSPRLEEPAAQERARLLAGLTALLTPLTLFMIVVSVSFRATPMHTPEWLLAGAMMLVGVTTYGFSRTRWYNVSVWILIGAGLLFPYAAALLESEPHRIVTSFLFGLGGVFYCSFFLSTAATFISSSLLVVLALTLPALHPLPDGDAMILPTFLIVILTSLQVFGSVSRKRGIERLHAQTLQLKQVIEKTPDCMAVLRDDAFVYTNPALVAALGYSDQRQLIGTTLSSHRCPNSPAASMDTGEPLRSDGVTELSLCRSDGRVVILELSPPQQIEFEGHRSVLMAARDVTESHLIRKQMVMTERMAALGTVAASVAHEINNPLSYIVSNLEFVESLIRADTGSPPIEHQAELLEALNDAHSGASRVQKIAGDLNYMTRGPGDLVKSIDLGGVVDSAISIAGNEIRHRARLTKDYCEFPVVDADETRLCQVFVNLLVNAAQAMESVNPLQNKIHVTIGADETGHAIVTIKDTGRGIEPNALDSVLEPFYTTKAIGEGTGLGLAICVRTVRDIGGTLQVDSVLHRGTTVTVALPPSLSIASAAVRGSPARPDGPLRRASILIVDDDARVASAMKRILPQHDVTITHSVREAVAACEKAQFDIIFCDVMMPEQSGVDFYQAFSEKDPVAASRVIFMTGGAFTPREQEFVASSSNPKLSKPFDVDAVNLAIAALLDTAKPDAT